MLRANQNENIIQVYNMKPFVSEKEQNRLCESSENSRGCGQHKG